VASLLSVLPSSASARRLRTHAHGSPVERISCRFTPIDDFDAIAWLDQSACSAEK